MTEEEGNAQMEPTSDEAAVAWLAERTGSTAPPLDDGNPIPEQETGEPVSEVTQEEGDAQSASETSPELESAVETLQRGWSKAMQAKMLDGMTDAEKIAEATRMTAKDASFDTQASELDRLRKEVETLKTSKPQEGTEEPQAESQPSSTVTDILASLDADLYGDELAPALTALAAQVRKDSLVEAQQLIAANDQRVDGILKAYVADDVRRQLGDEFPSLRDDGKFEEVSQAMADMEPAMKFADTEGLRARQVRLMRRAAQVSFPGEALKPTSTSPDKPGGQPTAPTRKPEANTSTRTQQDSDMTWLETYQSTGSSTAANRAIGL